MIHDYSTLKEGDVVAFMITGMVPHYRGVILTTNGYQNRPEIKVTHLRRHINDPWEPDTSWDKFPPLKGDDYILQEVLDSSGASQTPATT